MGKSIIKNVPAERSHDIWAVVEKYRARKFMKMEELSKRSGISVSKLYDNRKRPWLLRLEDIFEIAKVLQIPEREIAEAYLGKRIVQMEEAN